MELRLAIRAPSRFFWPLNSTTVRSLRATASLIALRLRHRVLRVLSAERAIAAVTRDFMRPPRHPFSDAELAVLEEASLLPVPLVTGRLVGWRWGDASRPTVVLVHGWGGRGTQLRGFVAPLLARGLSVVCFDAPGHGMTGGRESSLVHFVAALEALAARIGPVRGLVAHSMGGAATAMVMARGLAAERAVLIAPPASLIEASRRFAQVLGVPESLRREMQRKIQHRFGIRWDDFEAERLTGPQPMLVIHDTGDREVPFREGRRYVAAWPEARLMATEGLGHRRILADPAVIAAGVDFLAGSPS